MNIEIRKAKKEDAKDIYYISVMSWEETYRGMMDDEFLNIRLSNLTDEKVMKEKTEKIKNILNYYTDYYIALVDNKPAGILYFGKSKNEDYKEYAYLDAIYLLNEYQGYGIGKDLMSIAVNKMIDDGYKKMYLDCLRDNKTIKFYEKFGGEILKEDNYLIPYYSFIKKKDVEFKVPTYIVGFDLEKTKGLLKEKNIIKKKKINS